MRIVSLLASATEIVCALGLADQLVGVTPECDWPSEIVGTAQMTRRIRDVGEAAFELDPDALAAARPDLILSRERSSGIAGGHRRVLEVAAEVAPHCSVVSLDPTSIEGVFNTIATVGAMTAAEDAALDVVEELRARLRETEGRVQERRTGGQPPVRVVALARLDPPFTVGDWIPEQIRRAGGWDLLGQDGGPSIETSWGVVRDVDPDMLILMSGSRHLAAAIREWKGTSRPPSWQSLEAVRRRQVFAVDGPSYFGRPGPRVIDGIALLAEIFDPDGFVETSPVGSWTPLL